MNKIHQKFSNRFRTQWVKVKFYSEKPDLKNVKNLKNVRFCEAIKQAILHPIILDREIINCPGAQYALGWQDQESLLAHCKEKNLLT